MQIFMARQPIIDREKNLVGYELLFRDSPKNAFPNIDADEATSKLVTSSHFHLGLDSFTEQYPAFINFPELSFLVRVPEILPKEQVVIELLEDIEPTPELERVCASLKQQGYKIALDDFAYKPEWKPILPYVDIIKVDVLNSSPKDLFEIKKLKLNYQFELLAEKVESHQEYMRLMDMGFQYFQGYFFAKPEIIKKKGLSPSKLNLIQLLALISQADCNISELETILNRDVSLIYKLLRLVNSATFATQKEVNSVKQALVYLGENKFKRFLALLATANLADQKPYELTKLAITRARFAELLAEKAKPELAPSAFLVGLFSLIDAILDEPLSSILNKLPLSQEIKAALEQREGLLAHFIEVVQHYENARWQKLTDSVSFTGISEALIPGLYAEATEWCGQLLSAES